MLFEKLKQPIFNLFYIMTEGVVFDAGPAVIRKVIFLLFIDVLQVLRVMCSFRYGWTPDTTQIFKDTDLVAKLIPRYSFFILAAILVLVALMDSYYVVKLFAAGHVQTMWPVKVRQSVLSCFHGIGTVFVRQNADTGKVTASALDTGAAILGRSACDDFLQQRDQVAADSRGMPRLQRKKLEFVHPQRRGKAPLSLSF
eukprot:2121369-Rhodomonas_salina.2